MNGATVEVKRFPLIAACGPSPSSGRTKWASFVRPTSASVTDPSQSRSQHEATAVTRKIPTPIRNYESKRRGCSASNRRRRVLNNDMTRSEDSDFGLFLLSHLVLSHIDICKDTSKVKKGNHREDVDVRVRPCMVAKIDRREHVTVQQRIHYSIKGTSSILPSPPLSLPSHVGPFSRPS